MIYYFFYLKGKLVNDGIFREYFSVYYVNIDKVIRRIKYLGIGLYLIEIDVKSIFRIFFVNS